MKTLAERLAAARLEAGLTQGQLAERAGVAEGTIGNFESGIRKNPRELLALAAAVGVNPEWLKEGRGPRRVTNHTTTGGGNPVAQAVSLGGASIVPLLEWGALMHEVLPPVFRIAVPDNAMAPRVRAGQIVMFSTTEEPRPGDGVLVVDADGSAYFRLYQMKRPGQWQAVATNEAYQPLDSVLDGLRVIGVLMAVEARWG